MCYNEVMESQKKQNKTTNRRSQALLPDSSRERLSIFGGFFIVPDSLTDKAFGLEAGRIIAGSTPVQGIGNCAYRKEGQENG